MRLVRTQPADDLLVEIKKRFADFNRSSSPSKGRRYPQELQALVRQALLDGVKPAALRRITGVSSPAMSRWVATFKVPTARRSRQKIAAPRRLEVTKSSGGSLGPVVVRLPSGVVIELRDGVALSREFLASLATLEVNHAASR